jgi:hypothetical protein
VRAAGRFLAGVLALGLAYTYRTVYVVLDAVRRPQR